VLLGDDIVASGNLLQAMLEIYDRYGRSVIAAMEVPRSDIHLYGSIEPEFVEDNLARVVRIVEKPAADDAPSNLAAIGYYVLTPEIFDAIRETPPDQGGEVQLPGDHSGASDEADDHDHPHDHDGGEMRGVDEVRASVLERIRTLSPIELHLQEAYGCVLASDVTAELDIPPFTSSAMDGFAV